MSDIPPHRITCPFCNASMKRKSFVKGKHIDRCPTLRCDLPLKMGVLNCIEDSSRNGQTHYDEVVAWNRQRLGESEVDQAEPTSGEEAELAPGQNAEPTISDAPGDQAELSISIDFGERTEATVRQSQYGVSSVSESEIVSADVENLAPLFAAHASIGQPLPAVTLSQSQWLYFLTHPAYPGVVKVGHTASLDTRLSHLRAGYSSRELVYLRTVSFPLPGDGQRAEIQIANLLRVAGRRIQLGAVTDFFHCSPRATGHTEWYRLTHSEVHTLADLFQYVI